MPCSFKAGNSGGGPVGVPGEVEGVDAGVVWVGGLLSINGGGAMATTGGGALEVVEGLGWALGVGLGVSLVKGEGGVAVSVGVTSGLGLRPALELGVVVVLTGVVVAPGEVDLAVVVVAGLAGVWLSVVSFLPQGRPCHSNQPPADNNRTTSTGMRIKGITLGRLGESTGLSRTPSRGVWRWLTV